MNFFIVGKAPPVMIIEIKTGGLCLRNPPPHRSGASWRYGIALVLGDNFQLCDDSCHRSRHMLTSKKHGRCFVTGIKHAPTILLEKVHRNVQYYVTCVPSENLLILRPLQFILMLDTGCTHRTCHLQPGWGLPVLCFTSKNWKLGGKRHG